LEMKRLAEEPTGIHDRSVEKLSTVSEGPRPELGCPLPTHEVEARNPKNLLQSLSWRDLKKKMKTRRLARLALKRTLGWDARYQSFEMSLMTSRQMPAASVVCDCIGDALYMIGADLEIKGGGQEPYLVKAKFHTRSARTTRVQGEDTIFSVSSYDYPLCPRALKPP